jgi:hypothetical protein
MTMLTEDDLCVLLDPLQKKSTDRIIAHSVALVDRVKRLEDALHTIARWDRETFPRVPDRQNSGQTISYGLAYGSNGERDFMRNVALNALESK